MVRNIKLLIAYDGTAYHGWQTQLNNATVQETIEDALRVVVKQKVDLIGSGRTDSGVHALGQVANFKADTKIPEDRIKIAINANLPPDIRILDSVDISMDFNARFNAVDKTYMYQIYNDRVSSPFYSRYSTFVPQILDTDKMQEALKVIIGAHDFKGFMASGSQVKTTERIVHHANLILDGKLIKIYINGNGFLYNMVRIIAGTLIDIGKGLKDLSCMEAALNDKDRRVLGQTSAPEGLFLMQVNYKR
jgi:tRNA pseudouridine38-40 synthase